MRKLLLVSILVLALLAGGPTAGANAQGGNPDRPEPARRPAFAQPDTRVDLKHMDDFIPIEDDPLYDLLFDILGPQFDHFVQNVRTNEDIRAGRIVYVDGAWHFMYVMDRPELDQEDPCLVYMNQNGNFNGNGNFNANTNANFNGGVTGNLNDNVNFNGNANDNLNGNFNANTNANINGAVVNANVNGNDNGNLNANDNLNVNGNLNVNVNVNANVNTNANDNLNGNGNFNGNANDNLNGNGNFNGNGNQNTNGNTGGIPQECLDRMGQYNYGAGGQTGAGTGTQTGGQQGDVNANGNMNGNDNGGATGGGAGGANTNANQNGNGNGNGNGNDETGFDQTMRNRVVIVVPFGAFDTLFDLPPGEFCSSQAVLRSGRFGRIAGRLNMSPSELQSELCDGFGGGMFDLGAGMGGSNNGQPATQYNRALSADELRDILRSTR